jgi:hypothetical protein
VSCWFQSRWEHGLWRRRLIAETVAGDPETFSEAFLGKPNAEYCEWILQPSKWGGAIELSILARRGGSNPRGKEVVLPVVGLALRHSTVSVRGLSVRSSTRQCQCAGLHSSMLGCHGGVGLVGHAMGIARVPPGDAAGSDTAQA